MRTAAKSDVAPPVRTVKVTAGNQFTGYASLFGVEDQGRDVVMPGAFRASLARRPAAGVRLLFQHDPAEPIGVWLDLVEDSRGLYARGRLIPDVQRAREVLALVEARAIDGLSIGFKTKKARVDPATRVRRIFAVDLWEISIVTFPLLAGARVRAVKEARAPDARRHAPPSRRERGIRGWIAESALREIATRKSLVPRPAR